MVFRQIDQNHTNDSLRAVVDVAYLDLRLSVTLGKDLLKTCLEDADVVVDDSLLLCWVILSHDAYQGEISVSIVSTATVSHRKGGPTYLLISRK